MTKLKKPSNRIRFHLYRYQLLPITQTIQTQFAPVKITSLDDLKEKKNEFFKDSLKQCNFSEKDKIAQDAPHYFSPHIYVLRLAVNRLLRRNTRNFSVEPIENWPYCWVVINNNPTVQKIAVQINPKAFNKTNTVIEMLRKCVDKQLIQYQLRLIIEAMFDKKEFWSIAGQSRGKLLQVDFELISPNLANISKNLSIDLHALQQSTNTQRTHFQLNSDTESCLEVIPEDKQLASLVNYASEGGGDISLRIRGLRKKIRTATSVKETTIEGIDVDHATPEGIATALKEIIDG